MNAYDMPTFHADEPLGFEDRRVWAKQRLQVARDRMNRAHRLPRDHDIAAVKAEAEKRGEELADWEISLRANARMTLRIDSYAKAHREATSLYTQLEQIAQQKAKRLAADLAAAAAKRGELWQLPKQDDAAGVQPAVPAQQHHREGR